MSCHEVKAELPAAVAAQVSEALLGLGAGGVGWSTFEDVVTRGGWLVGYFADETAARAAWAELQPHLGTALTPRFRAVADEDWRESYKAHFRAWRCGRLHWVPEWERATHRLPRGHVAVYLDPGMAFGTGNHETTRLCCERLVACARMLPPRRRRAWRVIDAGCGSGILAISAAKLGCRHVLAFDVDADAVAIARANARRNGVAAALRTATGGIELLATRRPADLVLANIQADVLVRHAPALVAAVAVGGALVLSGILAAELAEVKAVLARAAGRDWRLRSRRIGEWADLMCAWRKP